MANKYREVWNVTVYPSYTWAWYYLDGYYRDPDKQNPPPKGGRGQDDMSPAAQKRIRNAVGWLVLCAGSKRVRPESRKSKGFTFKINLITLTLPAQQKHADVEFTTLLAKFLHQLKRANGLRHYIWRAEPQKNGNIHFHITTSCFVLHEDIRNRWNALLNTLYDSDGLSYIDRFELSHGHRDPNSTDVRAVRQVTNLAGYLAKYLGKQRGKTDKGEVRTLKCSNWAQSQSLSKLKPMRFEMTEDVYAEIEKQVHNGKIKSKSMDYGNLIDLQLSRIDAKNFPLLYGQLLEHLGDEKEPDGQIYYI